MNKCGKCNKEVEAALVDGLCPACIELQKMVDVGVKAGLEAQAAAAGKPPEAITPAVLAGKPVKHAGSEGFQRTMEMIRGLRNKDYARVVANADKGIGGDDPTFLLPVEYVNQIYALIEEAGIAQQFCQVINTVAGSGKLPRLSSAPVSVWAGSDAAIAAGWQDRGRQAGDTTGNIYGARKPTMDAGFDGVDFTIRENVGVLPIPLTLLEDTRTDIEGLLNRLFVNAALTAQDTALITGIPYGADIVGGLDPAITTNINLAAVADTPTLAELLEIQGLISPSSTLAGARYFMSSSVKTYFDTLRLVINPASLSLEQILGFPVSVTESMPTKAEVDAGGAGFPYAIFGNLNNVYLIQRKALSIDTSTDGTIVDSDGNILHVLFQDNMIALRLVQRLDIKVMSQTPFAKLDNI